MGELRRSYDVVVVGAGPTGVAAAVGFARQGAEVLLLEAAPQAAHRFAGEWIHPAGGAILEQLGIYPHEATAHHTPAQGFVVFPDDGSEAIPLDYVPAPGSHQNPRGLTCEHGDLVEALRESLAPAGVRMLAPARVVDVQGDLVRFRHDGQEHTVRGARIVGADGRSSVVRQKLRNGESAELVSRMAGLELNNVELPFEGYGHVLLGGPGPILLYRIDQNRARVCIDLPAQHPERRTDAAYLWEAFGPRFPKQLRPAFRRALEEQRLSWAANRFLPRTFYGEGAVSLVGDAVGFYHPLTASGITIGLKDVASLLASPDAAAYQKSREPESYVPELLANALYQVFVRDDAGAAQLRKAVFDTWRREPSERRRTMAILAGDESRLREFGGAFVGIAWEALREQLRHRGPKALLGFAEWGQWPAAALVPGALRRRVRKEASRMHPLRALGMKPTAPVVPELPKFGAKANVDIDALLAKVDGELHPDDDAALLEERHRQLRTGAALAPNEQERRLRSALVDVRHAVAEKQPRLLRVCAETLAEVELHAPGLRASERRDAQTSMNDVLRGMQLETGAFGSLRQTAYALEALHFLGAESFDPALRRAYQWVASCQRESGAFGDDAHTTALVVRALLRAGLPAQSRVEAALESFGSQERLDDVAGQALRLYRELKAQPLMERRSQGKRRQESDWEFCRSSLLAVSRSFARPIEVLPGNLRVAVTCGYLLCRIADTVEDNAHFSMEERDLRYAAFLRALRGSDEDARDFDALWGDVRHENAAELSLAGRTSAVMRVFRTLPEAMQTKTAHWVEEMTRGMQLYSHRPQGGDGMTAIYTPEDLERYCYFVAGTVGHMLTDLFVEELGLVGTDTERKLRTEAEAFGVGLQFVNILKDVTDDRARDVSFIPRTLCSEFGFEVRDLVLPECRSQAHEAVGVLFDRAEDRLRHALEYTLALPADQPAMRLFCLLPLWMAVRTLVHARGNDAMFQAENAVKIDRKEVEGLIADCMKHAGDDSALRETFGRLWDAPLTTGKNAGSIAAQGSLAH